MSDVSIYVVTHKLYDFPSDKAYKPIVAGACSYDERSIPSNYLRDDCKINISNAHDLYSEFTVNYWVWKNDTSDIVGINHYRRYFIYGGWGTYLLCLLLGKKMMYKCILSGNDVNAYFNEGYNCILPKKQWRLNRTLREEFAAVHSLELLDKTDKIISTKYQEYLSTYAKVFNSRENHQKCICIMTKDKFDEYSKWLFGVFEELIALGVEGHDREFAYLGERLMNVWVEKKIADGELRVKEAFFVNTEFPIYRLLNNHTEYILPSKVRCFLEMNKK